MGLDGFNFWNCLPPQAARPYSYCSSRHSSTSSLSSSRGLQDCVCLCSSTPPSWFAAFHCVPTALPYPGQSCSAQTRQSAPQTLWLVFLTRTERFPSCVL